MKKQKSPVKILNKIIGFGELFYDKSKIKTKRKIYFDFFPTKEYKGIISSGKMIFIEHTGECNIFSDNCEIIKSLRCDVNIKIFNKEK